ncbi:hypothetical protein POTOM_027381 [Populus tomentosa]|uniref:Transmembrane protein n=1 Tax=Populus tomentosa TaxID=118781 RepID=A0A8X7ZEK4_POPTO|nr:hypothetical protein POTOM_027381 [Populus tomentosa]
MSLTTYHHHHLLFNNSPHRITLLFTSTSLSFRNLTLSRHVNTSLHSHNFHFKPQTPKSSFNLTLKAYQSDPTIPTQDSKQFNLDQFLSVAELLCIFSSSIITISYALNYTVLNSKRGVLGVIGSNTGFAWGMVVMVSGVVIGAWIRRRQWWRVSRETGREGSRESLNLVGRIEKLEEDLRSSATIIRVLSRQLEKLGIRFRVTRKALKEPIAEVPIFFSFLFFSFLMLLITEKDKGPEFGHGFTDDCLNGSLLLLLKFYSLESSAKVSLILLLRTLLLTSFNLCLKTAALAQKNSDATRALAVQEDILEKELGEIQKVLLAMQEQQQKQLELILAIGKSGKLWDNRREPVQEQELIKTSTEGVNQLQTHETQPLVTSKGSNNDIP